MSTNPNRQSIRGAAGARSSLMRQRRTVVTLSDKALEAALMEGEAEEEGNHDPLAQMAMRDKEEQKRGGAGVVMEVEDEENPFALDSPPPERESQLRKNRRTAVNIEDEVDEFIHDVMGGGTTSLVKDEIDQKLNMIKDNTADIRLEQPGDDLLKKLLAENQQQPAQTLAEKLIKPDNQTQQEISQEHKILDKQPEENNILDEDKGVKLRLTNRGVIDLDSIKEKEPSITDDPFQDSEEDENDKKAKFKPFTSLHTRQAKYNRRETQEAKQEEAQLGTKEATEPPMKKLQLMEENEQQTSISPDQTIQKNLKEEEDFKPFKDDDEDVFPEDMMDQITANPLGQRRQATIQRGNTLQQQPARQETTGRSKANNRVAKIFKEDDDLFGHIERLEEEELVQGQFEHRSSPLDEIIKQKALKEHEEEPIRDTFIQNFDDLIRQADRANDMRQEEHSHGSGELIDQILKEEKNSKNELASYYRGSNKSNTSPNVSNARVGTGSLIERRYNKQQQVDGNEETVQKDQVSPSDGKPMSVDKNRRVVGFAGESSNNDNTSDKESGLSSGRGAKIGRASSSESDDRSNLKDGINKLAPSASRQNEKFDFMKIIRASAAGHGRGAESRLTLRDIKMELPEENSSLESEEDEDHYLEWLEDEDKRIRESQQLMNDPEAFQALQMKHDSVPQDLNEDGTSPYLLEKQKTNWVVNNRRGTAIGSSNKRNKKASNSKKQRDLIDVIEELENEEEEDLDYDNEGATDQNEEVDDKISEEEEEDEDNLQSKEYYSNMYKDVMTKSRTMKAPKRQDNMGDKENEAKSTNDTNSGQDYKDLMKTIDWNERHYQEKAKALMKSNQILSQHLTSDNGKVQARTRIVSGFQTLSGITNKLVKERQLTQARSTCLGLTNQHVLVGNSEGAVWMFNRDNEQHYATFTEKSKEFLGNAVTAIDVHPIKPEFVILGFEKGQLVLLDVLHQPQKSLKVLKDHHRPGVPIINVKFCDWAGPQGKYFGLVGNKQTANPRESVRKEPDSIPDEKQSNASWMVVSIDADGNVMISSIVKIVIVFKITKYQAIDPMTSYFHTFQTMACRFQSPVHGSGIYDHIPMVAIGSRDSVLVIEAKQQGHSELLQINKPEKYYNKENQTYDPFRSLNAPAISWGYGMSPLLKDRPHSLLAVAWGPVIQLAVLIDHEEAEKPFYLDGFYITHVFDMTSSRPQMQVPVTSKSDDSKEEESKEAENQQVAVSEKFDFSAFQMYKSSYIEAMYFLSDSTLLILLSGQELRILDTQEFNPEQYDAERIYEHPELALRKRQSKAQLSGEIQTDNPEELEVNIRCAQVLRSEHLGFSDAFPLYVQTMKFNSGKLVMMTSKGLQSCQHLTWQQSIYDFQRVNLRVSGKPNVLENEEDKEEEDLTQVFLRALEIYKGRVKGYQGLIDNAYLRENFLRAELKLLVKEILQQVIDDTVNSVVAQSRATVDLQAAASEREKRFQRIIRIAIEFCVELKDCDFLFKDLCWLFQEVPSESDSFEVLFVKELEPYILAGKFQEWELPPEVIDSYIVRYYMQDDQAASYKATPQTFEQIIINLNLDQCPKATTLTFVRYCEEHFLTTGVVFLYTQLFERKDNASCVQVLFSLYDLYKRASEESASLKDLHNLRASVTRRESLTLAHEREAAENEHREVEKSQVYLGYKLLWVIRLFLNGKKFPSGNIKEAKWRAYVHDIIQFLSSQEILADLVNMDAETLFQVVSILFIRYSKPYDLVLLGRDDFLTAGPVNAHMRYQTHIEFLKEMELCILGTDLKPSNGISEQAKQQFLFFVANVVAKDKDMQLPSSFFFRITRELLRYHQQYLEFNKALQQLMTSKQPLKPKVLDPVEIMMKVTKLQESRFTLSRSSTAIIAAQQEEAAKLASEELRYVSKTENDFMGLLRKSEPLGNSMISELVVLSENTSFEQVQLYLLEKKEEYVKCLQMLLREADKKRISLEQQQNNFSSHFSFTGVAGHLSHFVNSRQKPSELPLATQLLIMSEMGAHAERKGDRTIRWLGEKIGVLEARAENSEEAKQQYKILRQESLANIKKLLSMSRIETVRLIEERFQGTHKEILTSDVLRREPLEQLLYLETLLEEHKETINETIRSYSLGGQTASSASQAKIYIDFIKQRLRLTCQLKPARVFGVVEQMVKGKDQGGNFYPIEDCLAICQEHGQIEAAFLLNKKLGRYFEAVNQGLVIMRNKVELAKVKIELYFAKKNNIDTQFCVSNAQMSECHFFDAIFRRVYNILVKHAKEVEADKEERVWYLAIDALLDLKQHDTVMLKAYCRRFFQQRLNMLVEAMSRTVSFHKFLEHALGRYQETQFKEFQEIILQIVFNQTSEENVLINANSAISKVNHCLFESFQQSTKFGVLFRQKVCNVCKKYLDKKWYEDIDALTMSVDNIEDEEDEDDPFMDDKVKVFACSHTFHIRCLRKHYAKKQLPNVDELFTRQGQHRLKCPTCNINSFEIENEGAKGRSGAVLASRVRNGGAAMINDEEDDDLRNYKIMTQRKAQLRQTRRESIVATQETKKIERLRRMMEYFDGAQEEEGLKVKDFATVPVMVKPIKAAQTKDSQSEKEVIEKRQQVLNAKSDPAIKNKATAITASKPKVGFFSSKK